jgi:hypothetical protein
MKKSTLSPARRRVIELMQDVHFGTIENLRIRSGEPQFEPPPLGTRDFVLGKFERGHPARVLSDFHLKDALVDLFELFDREQNIDIDRLTIQAGLPLRVRVRVTAAA